tara:strand:+ start:42005 stop:42301 length:297 start_codon:yes stop_codon:yes gene_type:complete
MKNKLELSNEEQELMNSIDNGEWETVDNFKEEKKRIEAIAHATRNKDKRVNLRITTRDFNAIQVKAMEEGIPYQTLLSSVIHKYAFDQFLEKKYVNRH